MFDADHPVICKLISPSLHQIATSFGSHTMHNKTSNKTLTKPNKTTNKTSINVASFISLPTVSEPLPRTQSTLSLLTWNIHGLNKHKLNLFQDLFSAHSIVLLTETWTDDYSDFYLGGFIYQNFPRKDKNKLA